MTKIRRCYFFNLDLYVTRVQRGNRKFELRKVKYQRLNNLADNFISSYDSKLVNVRQEIERLRSQTVNTQDAVDNINIILKNSVLKVLKLKRKIMLTIYLSTT